MQQCGRQSRCCPNKEGSKMNLYASGEDYLEAVLILGRQKGRVRSVDLALYSIIF